ncbi:hypothetical protein CMT41_12065 [Colwellia sp. MT41]|uniref:DUF423 domain-containing protein n=2 Tax=Colwellia TaxID=28228 RepID=A0ABQ0MUL1_9GAMM|nr:MULTISPECIES: DUF423 domain-containing protein [Colwellia]ALO35376.1 hypothetical protein CMT41_12065 [Colwellia sp. MT41]GAW96059.1 hypothetical protein MTCD1_01666 [Colwellia marinimaniae]
MNSTNMIKQQVKSKSSTVLLKTMMIFVGISGCFSVLFGAWLAHGGQALPVKVQSSLATALQYQFFHTLALFSTLVWLKTAKSSKVLLSACIAFVIGILCFCGVIYIKSFFELAVIGKLTPFGGIAFALAWLLLAFEGKNNF